MLPDVNKEHIKTSSKSKNPRNIKTSKECFLHAHLIAKVASFQVVLHVKLDIINKIWFVINVIAHVKLV